MGGSIGVESTVGVGSTFWFEVALPVAPAASEDFDAGRRKASLDAAGADFDDLVSAIGLSALAAREAMPQRRALEILLVEDVVLNQELITAILGTRGHHIDVVGNGSEAIMAVEDRVYDLVLMDLQMPHVDGLMATRVIRNLPTRKRFVPVVALTAAVLREQTEAALIAGMDDVLTKPVSLPALDEVLRRAAAGELRGGIDSAVQDDEVVDQLTRALGGAKVRSMRALLATTLTARFTSDLTDTTSSALKAEAHASIAGASMLGFVRFGLLCRAFIAATGDEEAAGYAALRKEQELVVRILATDESDSGDLRRIA